MRARVRCHYYYYYYYMLSHAHVLTSDRAPRVSSYTYRLPPY